MVLYNIINPSEIKTMLQGVQSVGGWLGLEKPEENGP
jgi:hypothetical protein